MEAQPHTHGMTDNVPRDEQTLLREPGLSPNGFTAVPNWLFTECTDLSLQAKWTFSLLLHYSWQDGQCFPGIETLAANMGTSRFSVMRWIGELKDYGLLSVKRRGLGQTNVYSLLDWKARQSAPGVAPVQRPDVAPIQHQDVAPTQHQDVVRTQRVDVVPVPHNKDTVVTKTQETKTQRPPVTPVDTSTKVDNSARNARAREAPDEQSIPRTTLDPRPDWVPAVTQQIQEHWGGNLLASEREEWREWVWENLRGEDQSNRARFLAYAFDNNRIPQLSSPRGVLTFLSKDLDSWRRSNRPTAKGLRRVEGGGSAARVPAHIQREHDQAYKPPQYSPESIARHLATIRKYKDEECAQRWLAENGLTETGT